jgi:hypothetical protein
MCLDGAINRFVNWWSIRWPNNISVVVAVAIALRLYTMKSGIMWAKCPKCSAVFDASRTFSGVHIGPLKKL